MFFKAELNKNKYEISIKETDNSWVIDLLNVSGDKKETFEVMKWDYIKIDDAISFLFNNVSYMINVVSGGTSTKVFTRGSYREISIYNEQVLLQESIKGVSSIGGENVLKSGMPGKIIDVLVKKKDSVKLGQPILIMEAMKMENEMRATKDAVVKNVLIKKDQNVEAGEILVVFDDQ